MTSLQIVLLFPLAAYAFYAITSVVAARNWHRSRRPVNPDWTPAVTILKPVRGADPEAYENFASFCRLDYPADKVQIVFGALDAADPALTVARQLQADFPAADIDLITQTVPPPGHNLKVCNLISMLPAARHDLLVLCDSDMRVEPDYLRRIVAPFEGERVSGVGCWVSAERDAAQAAQKSKIQNPKSKMPRHPTPDTRNPPVGLVTCPYRGKNPRSFAACLEALGIGADFMPSVMASRMLEGAAFAFGSTIALPRRVLEELGGFEALTEQLADDFRLGNGAAKAGYTVILSDYVVDDLLGAETFCAMTARRLRWARTTRSCRPAGYAGSIITHGLPFALLFLCASQFNSAGWLILGLTLALRFVATAWITFRYTRDFAALLCLPLLPFSDLFNFGLFIASFCGNELQWRGDTFRLLPGGEIRRVISAEQK